MVRCRNQVLAKSCKMVPVMLMGTVLGGKRYSVVEYLCALLIAAGISLFASQGAGKVARKLAAPNPVLGYSLCLANLMLDGYTNAAQVRGRAPAAPACTFAWQSNIASRQVFGFDVAPVEGYLSASR